MEIWGEWVAVRDWQGKLTLLSWESSDEFDERNIHRGEIRCRGATGLSFRIPGSLRGQEEQLGRGLP